MTQYYFQVIDEEMLLDLPKNIESLNNKLLKFLKNIEMKIFEKYRNENF